MKRESRPYLVLGKLIQDAEKGLYLLNDECIF